MADASQNKIGTGLKVVGGLILLSLVLFILSLVVAWWGNEMKSPAFSEKSPTSSAPQNPGP